MTLSRLSRRYRTVHYTESSVSLRSLRRLLCRVAVRGLDHEQPTLFLTNDSETKAAELVERYARRMLIENGIAENVDFFHLDALCSTIAIQVDLDVMLSLIANALYRHLIRQLVGFETVQPKADLPPLSQPSSSRYRHPRAGPGQDTPLGLSALPAQAGPSPALA